MLDPNDKKNSAPAADVVVGQGPSDVAVLTIADVKARLPLPGTEIAVVYTFKIAWVRDASTSFGYLIISYSKSHKSPEKHSALRGFLGFYAI